MLLRRLQDDPELTGVGAVLFDEFHERNLMSDLALGLVKKLQRTSRDDLKIVVMSATIQTGSVSRYLGQAPDAPCPVLTSDGRTFPVEIRFGQYRNRDPITEQAADAVELILRNDSPGDIPIFMPGMGEIRGTIGALSRRRFAEPVELIPLHGELPPADQDRAFGECNRRKVVVATNVAETSVTIDGIRHVIDSGLARVARFDSERGFGTLLIEEISRASADQRAGRAGALRPAPATGSGPRAVTSTGPSTTPRRFTEPTSPRRCSCCTPPASNARWISTGSTNRNRPPLRLPKIYCARSAPWPSLANGSGGLTEIGQAMLRLPMHPRFARMMIEGGRRGCVNEAALCAAFLSGRDILVRSARDDKKVQAAQEPFRDGAGSDFEVLIRAWQFARARRYNIENCRAHGIHAGACREAEATFRQLLHLAKRHGMTTDENAEPDRSKATALRLCILSAFADQICVRRDTGTLHCTLPHGRSGTLVRESVVQQSSLLVVAEIRQVSAWATAPRRCSAWPRPSSWTGCGSCFPTNSPPGRSVNLTPHPSGSRRLKSRAFATSSWAANVPANRTQKPPAKRSPGPACASGSSPNRSTTRSGC